MEFDDSKVSFALLGCGNFVRELYLKILPNYKDVSILRFIWSRKESTALEVFEKVKEWSPLTRVKFGDDGLNEIINSNEIDACILVLPICSQPSISLRLIKAGKHVLQEKPIAQNVKEGIKVINEYKNLIQFKNKIFAIGENYRFESGYKKAHAIIQSFGKIMFVQITAQSCMNSKNKYFHSDWRRDESLNGAFITDCGVHYVAGLRQITGLDVISISGKSTHRDNSLPPPDNVSAIINFNSGISGTMIISFSSIINQIRWKIMCEKGEVEIIRGFYNGKFGVTLCIRNEDKKYEELFYDTDGMEEELKTFFNDVKLNDDEDSTKLHFDPRFYLYEALKDLAIIETTLTSSKNLSKEMIVGMNNF